jgi:peptide/nickel transport system substrate-binding protein
MEELRTTGITRRAFLGGSLAAGGLMLVGCGNKSAPSNRSTASGSTSAKSLRIGIPGDVLLSGLQRFQASNQPLRRTVFDYLIDKNPDGSYRAALATAWEWSKDQKTLVLTLRNGVTYHTGRSFGPDDVIASVNAALDPKSGAQAASLLKRASGITKTGANQVTVTFDKPFASYLDALAMLPMIDSQTYATVADGKKVVGTGPFTWQSWTAGSEIKMAKNTSYWQSGKPYLEDLTFSVITDEQALLAAMQSGQLDLANGVVSRDAATLQKTNKFQVVPSAGYDVYVGINTKQKPLDDVRVRQAIAYALDRERIVAQVYSGMAEPSCIPWSKDTPGVTQAQIDRYKYDLAKAKDLIGQAGAAGAQVSLTSFAADPATGAIEQIVQYGLTQIGLKVQPANYDAAAFGKHLQAGDFPGMWVTNVALTTMGPTTALLTANPLTPAKNAENFVTPEYQAAVTAVVDASQADAPKATAALTDYMLDQAFHNTVVQGHTTLVAASGLSGVTADLTLAFDLTNARLNG